VDLGLKAWLSLAMLAVVMALLIFVPAGDIRGYPEAWVYLAIFVGASAWTTVDLLRRDPALLVRRMRGGPTAESRPLQRIIMLFASSAFIALLVVPGFDHRFRWSSMSPAMVIAGDVLVAVGFYGILRVYRANSYSSATIGIASGQTLVSTGPYAIVRHPMYSNALLYTIGTPLALRSWWGLVAVAVMFLALVWRLMDEERLLALELPGYAEYRTRVRYRLIPRVW
jgi:protein-S-isoprenylcysteine O-methyltransferase Ste14